MKIKLITLLALTTLAAQVMAVDCTGSILHGNMRKCRQISTKHCANHYCAGHESGKYYQCGVRHGACKERKICTPKSNASTLDTDTQVDTSSAYGNEVSNASGFNTNAAAN